MIAGNVDGPIFGRAIEGIQKGADFITGAAAIFDNRNPRSRMFGNLRPDSLKQRNFGAGDVIFFSLADAVEDVGSETIWVELVDEQQKSDAFWTELETWKQSR